MYRKILLPTDGSPISRKAVKQGIALAKQIGAKVVGFFSPEDYRAMTTFSDFPAPGLISEKVYQAQAKAAAEKQLGFVEKSAKAAGVAYEGYYLISIAPWQAIIEAAKNKKCDLIIMGSHGRSGLAGIVLGSQATKVLTHSKVPVLITR
jgi:nucleotide-binding universal stress UspA family protein